MPPLRSSATSCDTSLASQPAATRVRLERPSTWRAREFVAAALRSRALHVGFVAVPATAGDYRDYLRSVRSEEREGFLVVTTRSDELAGVVDINDIVRGPRPWGRIGYYAFVPFAGHGLMREGVALAVSRAFGSLGFVRLEANVQPHNARSIALLGDLGFRRTGAARGYLKIGTRWRSHERWVLDASEWHEPDFATHARA